MSEEIKMVALRIRSLRELSDLSTEEVSRVVNVPVEVYEGYESGAADIPVSILYQLASLYHVELTVLLTGEDPHMDDFFVVRRGKGVSVDRRKDYGYQNLAYGFTNKTVSYTHLDVYKRQVLPWSRRPCRVRSNRSLSRWWRPMLGSSRM